MQSHSNLSHRVRMHCYRIKRTRLIVILLFVVGVCILYSLRPAPNHKFDIEDCTLSEDQKRNLEILFSKLQDVLDSLKLFHFMCYYSLWGALKLKGPLPWIGKIEMCLLNEDVSKVDEAFLIRTFKRYDLGVSYESGNGVYHITLESDDSIEAELILFELDSITKQYRRVGWKNRLLPPESCESLHCFPPHLVNRPLPTLLFLGKNVAVPREEIEIQKYLFPYSWWKDLQPDKCKTTKIR